MARPDPDNWRGSDQYWEKLVEIYSAKFDSNSHSYIFVSLADAQANLGRVEEAIETLEYGLALLPNSRAARVLLAQLYYDRGKAEKAREILVEVVDRWPDTLAAVSLLCRIYEKEGNIDTAKEISGTLMNYYPDSPFVKKMAAHYETLGAASEMTFAPAPDRILQLEAPQGAFADILSTNGDTGESREKAASRPNGQGRRKTLLALESILSQITRLRNREKVKRG